MMIMVERIPYEVLLVEVTIQKTGIKGVLDLKFDVFEEIRGNIWTTYTKSDFEKHNLLAQINFNHDKFSVSNHNVFRGFHGDHKSTKLVTCVYGDIIQLVLDWRQGSNTFGEVEVFDINRNTKRAVLIPPGCGNAYYVKSDQCVYHYKLSYEGEYIDSEDQFTVQWHDANIKNFPFQNFRPITSERDK